MKSIEDTQSPTLKSFFRRLLNQISKWFLLLVTGIVILLYLLGSETTEYEHSWNEIKGTFPGSNNQLEVPGLDDIQKHLFQYNPSLPTRILEGYNDEKHTMANVVAKRLNYKTNGFFVECGAVDGIYHSNTLFLEKEHNWTGLLVEADPKYVSILKGRNRKAWVADVCLSPQPVPIKVDMVGHAKSPGKGFIENQVLGKGRWPSAFNRNFQVQCFPLEMLMAAVGRTEIDYMSLDVEGLELEILKTIPFERIHIQIISVEVRDKDRKGIQNFLEPLGYTRFKRVEESSVFLIDDLYEFTG